MATEEKILERVRNMIARAEHPNTPKPEADLCRERANLLMTRHAIEQAVIDSQLHASERRKPTTIEIKISRNLWELSPALRTILHWIADVNRCKAVLTYDQSDDAVKVFGFQDDLNWVELLYTNAFNTMLTHLNPKWDESKSYDENVYNHKVAGYKWRDINEIAMVFGAPDARPIKPMGRWSWELGWHDVDTPVEGKYGKMLTAYKRHAKLIDDTNIVSTQSFEHYRRSYIEAFKIEFVDRLVEQKKQSEQEISATSGAELALVDSSAAVDELLWEFFPGMHPDKIAEKRLEAQERKAQRERERNEMLDSMTPDKRQAFLEKEERANERDWKRREARIKTADSSAWTRGRRAAESIDIQRKSKVTGSSRKGIES